MSKMEYIYKLTVRDKKASLLRSEIESRCFDIEGLVETLKTEQDESRRLECLESIDAFTKAIQVYAMELL